MRRSSEAPVITHPHSEWTPLLRLQALLVAALILTGLGVAGSAERGDGRATLTSIRAERELAPAVPTKARPSRLPQPAVRAARGAAGTAQAAEAVVPGRKWLPTGTGMWTHMWDKTEGGDARKVVRRAQEAGLSHLFVRTGTKKGGFDGAPILSRLLPATRGTDVKIIAWDFPYLVNPKADALRLAKAALYVPPGRGTPRVAAVAPDIETGSEGTRLTGTAVRIYYRELRRLLPSHIAILATVPWPSELRVGRYPYAESALYADAFIPMAYWMNRDPSTVAKQSMRYLQRFGKPIMPAGQAYDPKIDRPDLTHLRSPSRKAITHFVAASREMGAPSVSFWVWQTADRNHWTAIGRARHLFTPRPAGAPATVTRPTPRPAPGPRPAVDVAEPDKDKAGDSRSRR
ncbi:MAG TPA: hypothetical protein VNA12_09955 [Mycobacteriales bacterium]|nr:hypothetical protein [Mycobacteriales bacterium]